jgi:heme A synthase
VVITLFSLRKNLSFYFQEEHASRPILEARKPFKIKLALFLPGLVLFLTIFEALIGAKLVLSGLVGSNTSWARANIMILHLLNTFLLVSSIVGTIYFLSPKDNKLAVNLNLKKSFYSLCTLGLISVAALGALTALGDTLYPSDSLHHGVYQDFALNSPWILRLRIFHPMFAVFTVFLITILCQDEFKNKQIKIYLFLTYLTLVAGIINLLLLAPIYMQLIHLLAAQALWSAHSQLGFQLFIPKVKSLAKN